MKRADVARQRRQQTIAKVIEGFGHGRRRRGVDGERGVDPVGAGGLCQL
jgi:hypothetical protein